MMLDTQAKSGSTPAPSLITISWCQAFTGAAKTSWCPALMTETGASCVASIPHGWVPLALTGLNNIATPCSYVFTRRDGEWKPEMVVTRLNRAALCVQWSPCGTKFAIGELPGMQTTTEQMLS